MFRLPREADTWIQYIRPALSIDFDVYYFCLMAGLAKGEKESLSTSDTRDLLPRFPIDYRSQSRIIIALFLKTELDKLGISLQDKSTVNQHIRQYISPENSSELSEHGEREINKYANRGIELLKEKFGDKPRTIEAFLIRYPGIIHGLALENSTIVV